MGYKKARRIQLITQSAENAYFPGLPLLWPGTETVLGPRLGTAGLRRLGEGVVRRWGFTVMVFAMGELVREIAEERKCAKYNTYHNEHKGCTKDTTKPFNHREKITQRAQRNTV